MVAHVQANHRQFFSMGHARAGAKKQRHGMCERQSLLVTLLGCSVAHPDCVIPPLSAPLSRHCQHHSLVLVSSRQCCFLVKLSSPPPHFSQHMSPPPLSLVSARRRYLSLSHSVFYLFPSSPPPPPPPSSTIMQTRAACTRTISAACPPARMTACIRMRALVSALRMCRRRHARTCLCSATSTR